ncbi:MAG: hypothetical protein WC755_07900 [Candidatus Woesearchaeota archaeon]|jgi:hypothetical protein
MNIGDVVEYDPSKKDIEITFRTDNDISFTKEKFSCVGTIIYMTSSGKKQIRITEILNGV